MIYLSIRKLLKNRMLKLCRTQNQNSFLEFLDGFYMDRSY